MLVHCSVGNQLKFHNKSSEIIGLTQQIDHRLQSEKYTKKIHLVLTSPFQVKHSYKGLTFKITKIYKM